MGRAPHRSSTRGPRGSSPARGPRRGRRGRGRDSSTRPTTSAGRARNGSRSNGCARRSGHLSGHHGRSFWIRHARFTPFLVVVPQPGSSRLAYRPAGVAQFVWQGRRRRQIVQRLQRQRCRRCARVNQFPHPFWAKKRPDIVIVFCYGSRNHCNARCCDRCIGRDAPDLVNMRRASSTPARSSAETMRSLSTTSPWFSERRCGKLGRSSAAMVWLFLAVCQFASSCSASAKSCSASWCICLRHAERTIQRREPCSAVPAARH